MTTPTIHKLTIGGMNCMNCVTKIDQALRNVDGVLAVHVDLDGKIAAVSGGSIESLTAAITAAGFTVEAS